MRPQAVLAEADQTLKQVCRSRMRRLSARRKNCHGGAFHGQLGAERILRPGVLRVAAPKLLADLRIGPFPEAGEVVGHLLRPVVWPEEVQQDRHPTAGHPRRFPHSKEVLDPNGQHGWLAGLVGESMPLVLDLNMRRGEPLDLSDPLVTDGSLDGREPVGGLQFVERPQAVAESGQEACQNRIVNYRKPQFGEAAG